MKKRLFLFSVFIGVLLLIIPSKSFADMDAPSINWYMVDVSNPNGATYYYETYDSETDEMIKHTGQLRYGEEIVVQYEELIDGEIYGIFIYNERNCTVKISDLSKLITSYDNVDFSEYTSFEVLKSDGIEMYLGPAYNYEKSNIIIPQGTTLTGYRTISSEEDGYNNSWYYVEYDGNTGWICELNGVVGFNRGYFNVIKAPVDINIFEDAELETPIAIIPANTVINDFMSTDDWSRKFYVTYNGISGYISMYNCAVQYDYTENNYNYTISYNNAKLYSKPSIKSEIILENIPINTEISPIFEQYDIRGAGWIYTNYNGKLGWVYYWENYSDDETKIELEESDYLEFEEAVEVDTEKNSIKKNNNQKEEVNTNNSNSSGVFVSGEQLTLICVCGAVVIAIMAIVIIVLVNKGKKNNTKNDTTSE